MISHIQAGDIAMAYELTGPSDAPVVCLNHCFATDHRFWDLAMPALAEYRVLRYDSRGHGETDKPEGDYSLSMMAGDVVALLDALDIDVVNFVGISMGGMIGQTLTLEHPHRVKSLTIGNVPCQYTDTEIAAWKERARVVLDKGIEGVHEGLMSRWFTDNAAKNQIPGYVYLDTVLPKFKPRCFASATAAMCGLNTTDRLSSITQPVMIVASPDDPGVPVPVAEMMAERIPDSRLHWLHPAHHLATLEHPDKFNTLLVDFLKEAN